MTDVMADIIEPGGSPQLPPVRTNSGGAKLQKVVGFDTSPASVLRFQQDDAAQTPSPMGQRQQGSLRRELSRNQLSSLPRLTINTKREGRGLQLKKSKSYADLRPAPAQPIPAPTTQPSSPASCHSQGSSAGRPVRIPFELSRARHWAGEEEEPAEAEEYISDPVISAASSLASHRAFSPAHRSVSCRELFEAQADVVTAQAQVQGLHSALKREHEEVLRLREQLSAVTAERDRLLAELREVSATPRVFDLDISEPLRSPFSSLRVHR